MRRNYYTLSCRNVSRCAVRWLVHALGWTTELASLGPELLVQLLVRAASEKRSLSAIVRQAHAVPSLETVRQALLKYLPGKPEDLLPATTRALHSRLPKALKKRPRTMAIDWHLRPYYGTSRTPGIYRGQPKASTKVFFAYASLLVIRRGQTFTVGLTPVVNGEEQTAVIARLVDQAKQAGLRVRRLLLDRGFYAAPTIQWLQEHEIGFIMPMLKRGKSGRTKATCTATAKFFVRRRRGWSSYTWTARPRGKSRKAMAPVTVAVCMTPRPKGKDKQKGPLVYACHKVQGTPEEVRKLYRRRFRIETSYRQLGQGLAATCSKNRVYRFLLVAIALMLRNLWVWLHWTMLAKKTAQGRQLQLHKLRLRQLTYWLMQALNKSLAIKLEVITTCPQLTNA